MSDHNFKRLRAAVLALSKSQDWKTAKTEWTLVRVQTADEPEVCPCGHDPIIELCTIRNHLNGNELVVGNVCVQRFMGINSVLIFDGLKRVARNVEKGLNEAAIEFCYSRRLIDDYDRGFLLNTQLKRDLSPKQMHRRLRLNGHLLAALGFKISPFDPLETKPVVGRTAMMNVLADLKLRVPAAGGTPCFKQVAERHRARIAYLIAAGIMTEQNVDAYITHYEDA